MARILSLSALLISFVGMLMLLSSGAVFAEATALTTRTRKCRHITAIDPFPGKNDYSILYPHISEVTMRAHFHSHQVAGYVGKLNTYIRGVDGIPCPADEQSLLLHLVREMRLSDPLRKHAHQAYNHALYFAMLRKNRTLVEVIPGGDDLSGYIRADGKPDSADEEDGTTNDTPNIVTIHGATFRDRTDRYAIKAQPKLSAEIISSFGSIAAFKEKFVDRALNHFASGWIWLMVDPNATDKKKRLSIAESHDGETINGGYTAKAFEAVMELAKADTTDPTAADPKNYIDPSTIDGRVPLAVLDVWEHAYYLDYQSKRKEYVESWLKAVDWSLVERRLSAEEFEVPKSAASPERDYTYSVFY